MLIMKILIMKQTCLILLNGLHIVHLPCLSDMVYCGFAVDAGTRDEVKMSKVWHILNRMEAVGGELNAYTNKEVTEVTTYMGAFCNCFGAYPKNICRL